MDGEDMDDRMEKMRRIRRKLRELQLRTCILKKELSKIIMMNFALCLDFYNFP